MTLEELKQLREITSETPPCFIPCNKDGCDMMYKHCESDSHAPRCVHCQFWFPNLEKLEAEERSNENYNKGGNDMIVKAFLDSTFPWQSKIMQTYRLFKYRRRIMWNKRRASSKSVDLMNATYREYIQKFLSSKCRLAQIN